MIDKYTWAGHSVDRRTLRALEEELQVSTERQLVLKLKQDPSILWRIPDAGSKWRRFVIEVLIRRAR